MRILVLLAAAVLAVAVEQPGSELEKRLEAAIYQEMVLGDLAGAMKEYQAILARPGTRETTARTLLQLGECQERLGHHAAAQNAFRRVASEYADQTDVAGAARRLVAGFAGPRNLSFEEGVVGKQPEGWTVPVLPKDPNYSAELRHAGCRGPAGCATVMVSANAPRPFGTMIQTFSADAYRGKTVRLRAWLRVESARPDDCAQMRLAVDRDGFFDNMDSQEPVRTAEWTRTEVVRKIEEDVRFILIGVMSNARGRVWVDDISFEIVR